MFIHKKTIVILVSLIVAATIWVGAATNLVDQHGVLSGRVVSQNLIAVGVFVSVAVGVAVGVSVGDAVAVGVCVGVPVGVLVGVAVGVGVGVLVAVGVGVGVLMAKVAAML